MAPSNLKTNYIFNIKHKKPPMSLGGENREDHSLTFTFDKWRLPDSNWRAQFDRPDTSPE